MIATVFIFGVAFGALLAYTRRLDRAAARRRAVFGITAPVVHDDTHELVDFTLPHSEELAA